MWGDYNPRPWDRFRWQSLLDSRYHMNWNLLWDTVVGGLRNTRVDSAGAGVAAVVGVITLGLDFNSWPFFVWADDRDWQPKRVKRLLSGRGIPTWGWGFHANSYFFRVPSRQAHWAQYLLLSAGVPLRGKLLAGSRAIPPGWGWGRCVGDCAGIVNETER